MFDPVIEPAQRQHGAVDEGHRLRQALEPRRDPGAVLLGEFAGLLQAAARRQGQHHFAGGGMDAQRVTARLAIAAQLHEVNLAAELDRDDRRFADPARKQGA